MRLTEYIHWLNRTDIGIAQREKESDYTHLVVRTQYKRDRYQYQCRLQGKQMVK